MSILGGFGRQMTLNWVVEEIHHPHMVATLGVLWNSIYMGKINSVLKAEETTKPS